MQEVFTLTCVVTPALQGVQRDSKDAINFSFLLFFFSISEWLLAVPGGYSSVG